METSEQQLTLINPPILIGLCSPRPGSGKTTVAETLVQQHGFTRLSFATPLKAMMRTFFLESGVSPEEADRLITDPALKELPAPSLLGTTPRYAMQTLGTEWGRMCIDKDIWVSAAINKAKSLLNSGRSVVFDDTRFPNEVEALFDLDGYLVNIIRPDAAHSDAVIGHASEGAISPDMADYTIPNDRDIEHLGLFVSSVIQDIKKNT